MGAVLALAALSALVPCAQRVAEAQQDGAERAWLALGDSYSSGEGIPGTNDVPNAKKYQGRDCARATGVATGAVAWAVGAHREVSDELGIADQMFVACTGATTEEIASQIGEAQSRKGRSTWDLVTLSIAGNDIGFADVLTACLDLNGWGAFDLTPGCDSSEKDLRGAVDGLRDTLERTYDLIASKVRSGGDVIVVGYPHIIEEVARWDRWRRGVLANCEGIESYDVGMLRSVTGYLNQQIARAVDAADGRHKRDGVRFHFLDISQDPYEYSTQSTDRHALCAPTSWLNGVSTSTSSGDLRIGRSFHPMQEGHTNTARVLGQLLRDEVTFDDAVEDTGAEQTGPGEYTIRLVHPTWGPVRLVTHMNDGEELTPGPAWIRAYDASGSVRWSYEIDFMYRLRPVGTGGGDRRPPVDAEGHVFIDYDPGRLNGVVVLRPTRTGFEDFGSLYDDPQSSGRFYSSEVVDPDGDGSYEIEVRMNDCTPDCAGGFGYVTLYRWSGTDYVGVIPNGEVECGSSYYPPYGSENIASDIRARGVLCDDARALVDAVSPSHSFYDGPPTFERGGYSCDVEVAEDTLPAGDYTCRSGAKTVTWHKT